MLVRNELVRMGVEQRTERRAGLVSQSILSELKRLTNI